MLFTKRWRKKLGVKNMSFKESKKMVIFMERYFKKKSNDLFLPK